MTPFKKFFLSAWEVFEVVFVATATVFIIRTFLVQPFLVSGASMEPTFSDSNYLLVDEFTYRFRAPERGEVIVFRYPRNHSTFFIKRIIGLPGEQVSSENGTIKITKGGKDMKLREDYLSDEAHQSHENFSITLKDGQYFVLGDNRFHSFDSRMWGTVGKAEIIGLARLRVFPFQKFTLFEAPLYKVQ